MYPIIVENLLLPAVGIFTSSKFPRLASQMRRFDRLPAQRCREQQWDALRRILKDAYEQVPFYRERFEAAGLHPDEVHDPAALAMLPPVTRQEVAANFPDRITVAGADKSNWRFAATSGTTSQRMIVLHDFGKREAIRAAAVRSLKFSGLRLGSPYLEIPPDVCNIQCGLNREPEPPLLQYVRRIERKDWKDLETWSTLRGLIERQIVFRRLVLNSFDARGTSQPDAVLDQYVEQIRSYRPSLLKGLPTYLLALARYILRKGLEPPPVGEIRPMGSCLVPSASRTIARAFRCPVLEDYGSAELGAIGCECRPGSGLHLFSDLFWIEVVRCGVPVPPGETGRLLITDLTNRAMPLIRYDIGDVGRLEPGDCDCGRGTPRFRVLGRVQDTLISTAGDVLTEHAISDILYDQPGVTWFQLQQRTARSFDLQVVVDEDAAFDAESLAAVVASHLGEGIRVSVRRVRSITPETGGKYRFIKAMSSDLL